MRRRTSIPTIARTMHTVTDLARRFGITRNSVRNYAVEHEDFLSGGANPAKGKMRQFDDRDVRVLYYVVARRAEGASHEEIRAELKTGRWEQVVVPPDIEPGSMEPKGELLSYLTDWLTNHLLQQVEARISQLENERDYLREQLERERKRLEEAQKACLEAELRAVRLETLAEDRHASENLPG